MPKPSDQKPFKKGDILKGAVRDRNKAYHYVVFLKPVTGDDFVGIMLTRSDRYEDNILMKKEHFKKIDEDGFTHFKFNNTHFIKQSFIKFGNWGPYKKVGSLSKPGIQFIKQNAYESDPMEFSQYENNM